MQNFKLTHINNSGNTTSVLKWDIYLNQNDLDTDGDGTPDAYDYDSDNDGCSDVIEAGFTDSDPIPDQILGTSPVTVSSLGLVGGYDGYVEPRDGDLNGVYDFQEVGTPAIPVNITGQPAAQSICLGGTANFDVQTNLIQPIYQWQTFDGTQWIDLIDNGTHATNNLVTQVCASQGRWARCVAK